MTISNYGLDVVLKYCVAAVLIIVYTVLFIHTGAIRYSILCVVGIVTIFVLNFFRDPYRMPPEGDRIIISPADGKVVLIRDVVEQEYLKSDAVQVSIFMSPIDVHVNRFPISGIVGYFKYIPGEYIVAFDEKSSLRNERTHIGVDNNGFKILFKQIAGTVARRIVADITVGQTAKAGERFGMIKFGSRVDLIMPKRSHVCVQLNDRVVAGETVIAEYVS